MVAERCLTAMMLLEVEEQVELTGRECLPSTTQNLEKVEGKGRKELTAGDPDLPCWGSLGGPNVGEEALNLQWLYLGAADLRRAQQKVTTLEAVAWRGSDPETVKASLRQEEVAQTPTIPMEKKVVPTTTITPTPTPTEHGVVKEVGTTGDPTNSGCQVEAEE